MTDALSRDDCAQLIERCLRYLGTRGERADNSEPARQLAGMRTALERSQVDVVPPEAVKCLRLVVIDVGVPPEVIRGEAVGMFDITSAQHQMTQLRQVPLAIANRLLQGGTIAIQRAIQAADERSLPGATARNNVQGHLHWHAAALGKESPTSNAIYPSGDDLKKWVMQAYVEANAVEEGAQYLDDAWQQMWEEINTKLAQMPAQIREAASSAVETVTGVPMWLWGVGLAGLVGLAGYVAYKVATGPVGAAVATHYVGRR